MSDAERETPRPSASDASDLRRRAEEILRRQPEEVRAIPPEDVQQVIHELEVHQVELEIQNEELRHAQRELAQVRDRYRDLYDFAPVGYFTISEGGLILHANLTAASMFGVERGRLLKQPISRFILKADQDIYYLHRRELFTSHQPQVCEMRMVRGDGDGAYFWARIEARAAVDNEGRAVCRAVISDITARKEAEEERQRLVAQVRVQAQQLEQVLASVPAGMILLDASGQILQANPVAEDALAVLSGDGVSDVITHLGDRPLTELLTPPRAEGLWHEVPAEGRTFALLARPVRNGPNTEKWVIVLRDVTEEREAQRRAQQQERLASVGQLAAGIAHDLNNVMAVILLYAELAQRLPDLRSQGREYLDIIIQHIERASGLIQQMLDFSGRSMLERRPLDLLPFMDEVEKLLERTLPETIVIALAAGPGDYVVNADPLRLQQALVNLALNARDAMPEGGELSLGLSAVTLHGETPCATCGEALEGEWVRITVADTGTGITPEVLPQIFDPFFTTKEVGKGTGLGLAQVYGILQQHKGHIVVNTGLREGTTFHLYLPLLMAARPAAPSVQTPAYVSGSGETILIVEDNQTLRRALAESLKSLNYRTLEAGHGREALDVLEAHPGEVALVLSDLVMPVMGGRALFRAMRERGLVQPVLLLSGHPMQEELQSLKAEGVAGWMLKPPNVEHLSQLLVRALERAADGGQT